MARSIRIGVVIPAYDAAPWIGSCLTRLIAQTHPDWRAVVVDDGSRDGTAEAVACFRDPRIALLRQSNQGVSAARNRGLAALGAGCGAVLFLDADDWLAPDALARMAAALDARPDAAAAWGRFALMRADAMPGDRPVRIVRPRLPGGDTLAALAVGNRFANGGHVLIRAKAAHRAGSFATGLSFGEDWEYWVRLALTGPFVPVAGRAPLLYVRRRAEGAYASRAADPAAFLPALSAIYANPVMAARFPAARLAALRRAAAAECLWIAGRALAAAGATDGLALLRRSVREAPSLRRAALLAALHARAAAAALAA
ncbi:MAG: glycosyltransferase [Proteobacteria bacterium]|nr:glycosyltransferase [Pseudomonadota bacterium]